MNKTKIIAELCANHMGNGKVLESMIRLASESKIDIVKIQSYDSSKLIKGVVNDYKKYELTDRDHFLVKQFCNKYNIELLTTCFDTGRVDFLKNSLGFKKIKIAGPDVVNYKLLDKVFDNFEEVLVSTAAATMKELEEFYKRYHGCHFILMHCNPYYPTPLNKVNLMRMIKIREKFCLNTSGVGFSDHTLGTEAAKMAICYGAVYVEKHFTLCRDLPGPDQFMSSTIDDFKDIVAWRDSFDMIVNTSDEDQPDESYIKNFRDRWKNT